MVYSNIGSDVTFFFPEIGYLCLLLLMNYTLWKISISSSFEIKPPVPSRASQASEIVSRYIVKIQNVETGQKGRSMQSGEVPVGLWTSRQSTVPLLALSSSVPAGPRWFPRPRLAALLPSTFPSVPVGRAPSSPNAAIGSSAPPQKATQSRGPAPRSLSVTASFPMPRGI